MDSQKQRNNVVQFEEMKKWNMKFFFWCSEIGGREHFPILRHFDFNNKPLGGPTMSK